MQFMNSYTYYSICMQQNCFCDVFTVVFFYKSTDVLPKVYVFANLVTNKINAKRGMYFVML